MGGGLSKAEQEEDAKPERAHDRVQRVVRPKADSTDGSSSKKQRERQRSRQRLLSIYISLVINIYFLFCRTNSVRDLIFV
jgi:hypothetical protein